MYGLVVNLFIFFYLLVTGYLIRKRKKLIAAWLLLTLYAVVAIFVFYLRGVDTPLGVLLLGFVVILAGVMLGYRYIMCVAFGTIILLAILQILSLMDTTKPHFTIIWDNSEIGEAIGYSVILVIFALVVWLSAMSIERTMLRAAAAERALQKERDSLKNRLEVQKSIVNKIQQKELKQLYKFAELGQLTTIILHDLANYLSILTLDIDDLQERHQSSIAIKRAQESIFYIDTIIDQVRNQINDSDNIKKFNALFTLKGSITHLQRKLSHPNIQLDIEKNEPDSYLVFGDPLRLSQAITILVTNAVQASIDKKGQILVSINHSNSNVMISVKDFGVGITQDVRRTLFQPIKSEKGAGLGIGLFVTKQIIETHFRGKIWLDPSTKYTQFNIQIPKT